MRTQEEIIEQIREIDDEGTPFCFESSTLLDFIPSGVRLREFPSLTSDDTYIEPTRQNILREMFNYLETARDTIRHEKGLSQVRSEQRYHAWLWLLGDYELYSRCTGKFWGVLDTIEDYCKKHMKGKNECRAS
jgi:hypothetical protein